MAKNRKKVFPKPPVRFHSKLSKELGKWSNKVCPWATQKAIYENEPLVSPSVNERQAKQLQKLKANLEKRDKNDINYNW